MHTAKQFNQCTSCFLKNHITDVFSSGGTWRGISEKKFFQNVVLSVSYKKHELRVTYNVHRFIHLKRDQFDVWCCCQKVVPIQSSWQHLLCKRFSPLPLHRFVGEDLDTELPWGRTFPDRSLISVKLYFKKSGFSCSCVLRWAIFPVKGQTWNEKL